jgi:signal peptidase I
VTGAQAQEPPEQPVTPVGDEPADAPDEPSAESAATAEREPEGGKSLPFYQELVLLVGIALLLAVVIKALFLQAFYIPSGSMEDTLVFNDRILVEKVSYWGGGTPQRGDVVVFADPGGWLGSQDSVGATSPVAKALELFGLYPTGGHLVKRVIGVGGDTVKCCDKQGRITVNGTPLAEKSYIRPGGPPSQIDFNVKVEPGHLWVMGDNRSNSADSRFHLGDPGGGQVPVDDVVGKVFAVVWPLGHATFLHRPGTFEAVGGSDG